MTFPEKVEIIEVGPRDGIQNEQAFIPTDKKIKFIELLNEAGFSRIESTSFVSPKHVPQMADAFEVMEGIDRKEDIEYIALIPNAKGYERALETSMKSINLVVGASDTFNQKNVRMTREESMSALTHIIENAKKEGIFVRYSIATSFWCPYEGKIDADIVLNMIKEVDLLGVDEFTICDTIGKADPKQVADLFERVFQLKPQAKMTAHFHDTYGMAQANVITALQAGVTSFDAAVGGLGGCPFAPGAAGNLATEDLVYMLHQMGIETGIELDQLQKAVEFIKPLTSRDLTGHVHKVSKGD